MCLTTDTVKLHTSFPNVYACTQCSKAAGIYMHFYSLSITSCTHSLRHVVIYTHPCLCRKHLIENRGGERGLGEGHPASHWLPAVTHSACGWLYFWQAFRCRESLSECPHAVRSTAWSQALHFPRSEGPPGHLSGNPRKCLRRPHLRAAVLCPHGVACSHICRARGRPGDTVGSFCRFFFFNEIELSEALSSPKKQIPLELSNITQLQTKFCSFSVLICSFHVLSINFPQVSYTHVLSDEEIHSLGPCHIVLWLPSDNRHN